jgi:hypothetical protein
MADHRTVILAETGAIGAAVVVTVHPMLEHAVNVGWTMLAGIATAAAVGALKLAWHRWAPVSWRYPSSRP